MKDACSRKYFFIFSVVIWPAICLSLPVGKRGGVAKSPLSNDEDWDLQLLGAGGELAFSNFSDALCTSPTDRLPKS